MCIYFVIVMNYFSGTVVENIWVRGLVVPSQVQTPPMGVFVPNLEKNFIGSFSIEESASPLKDVFVPNFGKKILPVSPPSWKSLAPT